MANQTAEQFASATHEMLLGSMTTREIVAELGNQCRQAEIRPTEIVSKPWDGNDSMASVMMEMTADGDADSLIYVSMKPRDKKRWGICIMRHFGFSVGQFNVELEYPIGIRTLFLSEEIHHKQIDTQLDQKPQIASFFDELINSNWYRRFRNVKPLDFSVSWKSGNKLFNDLENVPSENIAAFLSSL